MKTPKVKGTLMSGLTLAVQALVENGSISREALEARLSTAAIEHIDEKPRDISWYSMEVYGELLDVLWDVAGDRDPAFMRGVGQVTAINMSKSATYDSFLSLTREEFQGGAEGFIDRMRIVCRLNELFYDFLNISVQYDLEADLIELVYENAEPFTEAIYLATLGFLNGLVQAGKGDIDSPLSDEAKWEGHRLSPDRIVYSHDLKSFIKPNV